MKALIFAALAAAVVAAGPAVAVENSPATLRGIALFERDKAAEGLAVLEAAAAQNDVSALTFLAMIYSEANMPERALTQAEAAVRLAPTDPDTLLVRAAVYRGMGQDDKARADYERILAAGPNVSAYFQRGLMASDAGDHEKALADFRLSFQTDPKEVGAQVNIGHELEALGRHEEALAAFELALKLEPKSYDAMIGYAGQLTEMERWEAARAAYESAAKAYPKEPLIQVGLGMSSENLGDIRRAQAAYTAATRLDPTYVRAWWSLGGLLHYANKSKAALEAFDRAIALDPVNADLLTSRGRVWADLGDDRALADFAAALKVDPKSAYAFNNRGLFYLDANQSTKALADFDAALLADPDYHPALSNRARTLLTLDRHDRALRDVNRAIELSPSGYYFKVKGQIYSQMGDHLQAVEAFDKAISLEPDYAEAWLMRSKSKAELGDKQAAAADRAQALKLDPSVES